MMIAAISAGVNALPNTSVIEPFRSSEALPEGQGDIEVTVDEGQFTSAHASDTPWPILGLIGQPAARLVVLDHGHGIDEEIRDKMFEPFVSTKNTVGVGMGMTVARHALRNLGGEVTMTDTEGGGATAILVHPLVKKLRKVLDE